MAVSHALHRVLLHQCLAAFAVHAQDRQAAAVAVGAIAQQHRAVVEGLGLVGGQCLRHLQAFGRKQQAFLLLGHRQQAVITGARIGDADAGHQLFGVDALVQDRIVDREEQAAIAGLHQHIHRLQQHAIATREDLPLRLIAFDGVGEQQERRQCIALVVGAFLVVAIGREQQVDLPQEAELVVLLAAAQGLLHQFLVAQHVAGHAGGGHRPRGVVMDLVVVLRFADEELGHRPEHLRFDGVAVLGGQRVTDRVIALDGVDQPHRIVEHLPEHAAGNLAATLRVRAQRGVKLGVLQQHVARVVHVGPVAGQPVQRARRQQCLVVALVLFMGAPAALVLGTGTSMPAFIIFFSVASVRACSLANHG